MGVECDKLVTDGCSWVVVSKVITTSANRSDSDESTKAAHLLYAKPADFLPFSSPFPPLFSLIHLEIDSHCVLAGPIPSPATLSPTAQEQEKTE